MCYCVELISDYTKKSGKIEIYWSFNYLHT